MRREDSLTQHVDWWLLSIVVIMLGMGIANVYSAAFDPDHPSIFDFSQKYGKQIMWVGISIFLGFLVFLIDSDIYRKFAIPIYLFCFSLLIVVLAILGLATALACCGPVGSAAFFQRTLISSRLNEAFRFMSLGDISLDNNSPVGFSPVEFTCAIQRTGSNSNAKILNSI